MLVFFSSTAYPNYSTTSKYKQQKIILYFFFFCLHPLTQCLQSDWSAVGSLKKPRSSGDGNGFSKYFPFVAMHAHHCCETRFVPEWKTKIAPGFFSKNFNLKTNACGTNDIWLFLQFMRVLKGIIPNQSDYLCRPQAFIDGV